MRVLLVHKFYHVTGGAEVFLFETQHALERAGHEVAVLSTRAEENVESPWSDYFVEPPAFRDRNLLRRIGSLPKIVRSEQSRIATRRITDDFRPDVAHVFNLFTHLSPSVLEALHEVGVPTVMTCNDYKHICPNYKLFHHGRICEECKGARFYRAVANRCCQESRSFSVASAVEASVHNSSDVVRRNVDLFTFSSDFMAHKTVEFWGVDTFAWKKLHNPFDSPAVMESSSVGEYALFIGRFVEEKGVELLVRAAALVPHIPVVVVGSGPQAAEIHGLVDSLQAANVTLVGPKWGPELDGYLDNARFVVVPSIWHENYPYVVMQSFARGKAVVGADRGGIPELVQAGLTGVIFDPAEVQSLVSALIDMWDDPGRAREMGHAAKEYSDANFNLGVFTNELSDCYQGVLR